VGEEGRRYKGDRRTLYPTTNKEEESSSLRLRLINWHQTIQWMFIVQLSFYTLFEVRTMDGGENCLEQPQCATAMKGVDIRQDSTMYVMVRRRRHICVGGGGGGGVALLCPGDKVPLSSSPVSRAIPADPDRRHVQIDGTYVERRR